MPHSPVEEKFFWERIYQSSSDREKEIYSKYIDDYTYIGYHLLQRMAGLRGQTILSVGGGVDRLAVFLARQGNHVTTIDLSASAVLRTEAFAREQGVQDRMVFRVENFEEMPLVTTFDVVLCKRCLHHMDVTHALPRIAGLIKPGGLFFAEEPVCLTKILEFFHEHVPIHTKPYIEGELQFNKQHLALFRQHFPYLQIEYFDCLTREVIAYVIYRLKMEPFLRPLGRFDYLLLNRWLPVIRYLSTFAIFEARR